jgi:hypothetical protein
VRKRPTVTGGGAGRTTTVVRGTGTPSGTYKNRIAVRVMCTTPKGWRSPSFGTRIGGGGMSIDGE